MKCEKCLQEYQEQSEGILSSHQCGKPSLSNDLVSLRWSSERPPVDGFYWSRVNYQDQDPEIVRVNNSGIFANGMWQHEIYVTGEEEPYLLDEFIQERGGEWCGPLPIPEAN